MRAEPRLTSPTQHPGIGILPPSDVSPGYLVQSMKLRERMNISVTMRTSAQLNSVEIGAEISDMDPYFKTREANAGYGSSGERTQSHA